MNLQLQPRTDPVPRHAYPACARSDLYGSCLRLPAPFDILPKLLRCHQHVTQVLSAHTQLWPATHHKHLKPIQRP